MQHDTPLPAHAIKVCRGAVRCPHAVAGSDQTAALEAVVAASGWPAFLAGRTHPIRHHHQFRITVASCPNGCSQPHIADFGLVGAARIGLDPEACSECGLCLAACAEKALSLDAGIRLDRSLCLHCAACARVCPTGALRVDGAGYRVLIGGKLGRHPRLAHELGTFELPQALDILGRVLRLLMEHHRPGLRLGDLVEEIGREKFDDLVRP